MMTLPDRIYAQYKNSPKAVAWYDITRTLAEQIGDAAAAVRVMYNIDSAEGEQLDIIGRIVNIDRSFIGTVELFPALFDLTDGGEFGDSDLGIFAGLYSDSDNEMGDELFRIAIRAKIIKNTSDATIESILGGMDFMFPTADVIAVVDGEDMSFGIEFFAQLTEIERWALRTVELVPRPQGVMFNGFVEGIGGAQFGDLDVEFGYDGVEFVGFQGTNDFTTLQESE